MILTLIELNGDGLSEASQQALTFARDLAGRADSDVVALSIGHDNAVATAELGRYGVSSVIRVPDDRLDAYAPAALARALAQVMADRAPRVVLAAGTDRGNEVMAHLAAMADLPLSANTLSVDADDVSRVTRMRWGSSLLEAAVIAGAPKLLTLALHAVPAEEVSAPVAPSEEIFAPTLPEGDLRVRLTRTEAEVVEGITLKNAPVVIGGGRGGGQPGRLRRAGAAGRTHRRGGGLLAGGHQQRLAAPCGPGGAHRHPHITGTLYRLRHQRGDPAPGRLQGRQTDPGDQSGPRGGFLRQGRLRGGGRSARSGPGDRQSIKAANRLNGQGRIVNGKADSIIRTDS